VSVDPDKAARPLHVLLLLLACLAVVHAGLYIHYRLRLTEYAGKTGLRQTATSALGLSDLCVATEARYTRHPAASDGVVPFMDHPGAIEHFPTGSFWAPPVSAELTEVANEPRPGQASQHP
jgi:hypothetical protein